MSNINTTRIVNNDAHDDYEGDGNGQAITPVEGGQVELSKTVASEDAEKVEWSIDLTVPKGGLATAEVTDDLPHNLQFDLYDIFESIEVTGLINDETYEVDEIKNSAGTTTKLLITYKE